MAKASNSKKPTSESSQTGKKRAPKSSKPAESKPKQLEWGSNPTWIQRAIEHLTCDVKFRLRLFSDTTSGAKAEGRSKVQASESKIALYGVLAAAVFKTIDDEAIRQDYEKDPTRFARSTQQQFQRLKKTYLKYSREIQGTGEGLKRTDGEHANLIERIREEWPCWDDLHAFWSELPNYNPVGVSTSTAGQDFGAHAAALFMKPSDKDEEQVSDAQSNHGSGIPDLDCVDPGLETLSQDWNLDRLERDFAAIPAGGYSGTNPYGSEDTSKETKELVPSVAQLPEDATTASQSRVTATSAVQHDLISRSTSRSSTPAQTSKDDTKGKSSKNQAHTMMKRSVQDAFREDIHVLELKEAAERRAQKNAIRLKELELQEKRQAAKVRKMEMDAEIQKAQLNMLSNMANMFASGPMGAVGGIHAANHAGLGSGPSTQLGGSSTSPATTADSWVHSQHASTSSSGTSQSALTHSEFDFPANNFNFPSSWKPGDDVA